MKSTKVRNPLKAGRSSRSTKEPVMGGLGRNGILQCLLFVCVFIFYAVPILMISYDFQYGWG